MITTMPGFFSDESALREKARLNASIAKDLADSFGGDIADYLTRLNRNLKKRTSADSAKHPLFNECHPSE